MCAKAIHHSGIVRVYSPIYTKGEHYEGLNYLTNNNVEIRPLPQENLQMKEMIDYFLTMITPPVEDAKVLVAKPSEIDFESHLVDDTRGYASGAIVTLKDQQFMELFYWENQLRKKRTNP